MGIFLFVLSLIVAIPSWANVECLLNKRKSYAIRGQRENRQRRVVQVGKILPFLGENRAGTIYKTEIEGQTFFVSKKFFVKVQKESCSSTEDLGLDPVTSSPQQDPMDAPPVTEKATVVEKPEPTQETQNWFWGLEGGYSLGLSAKSFDNILTPTPDPTADVNDDAFDSPFIDEVKKGNGLAFRGFLEYRWNDWFRTKFFLGYSQREFEYIFRQNPHNTDQSFVTYDQLSQSTDTFTYQAVQIGAMPKLRWDLEAVAIDFGLGVFFNYYFEVQKVEFRTAPLKLTPYYVGTGYKQFDIEFAPRIEVHVDFIYVYGQFNNQLSPSDFSMSPEVGLGLTF